MNLKSSKLRWGFLSVLCIVIAGSFWYAKEGDATPSMIQKRKGQTQQQQVPPPPPPAPPVQGTQANADVNNALRVIAARSGVPAGIGNDYGIHIGQNQTLAQARDLIAGHIGANNIDLDHLVADINVTGGPIVLDHVATLKDILVNMRKAIHNMAHFLVDGYKLNLQQVKNGFNGTHNNADLRVNIFNSPPNNRENQYTSPNRGPGNAGIGLMQ